VVTATATSGGGDTSAFSPFVLSVSFAGPDAQDLGPNFQTVAGSFMVQNNQAVTTGRPSVSLVQGLSAADVAVEATVTAAPQSGSSVGLVARYAGPGNKNYYYAGLSGSAGGSSLLRLWKCVGGVLKPLSASARVSGTSGDLRFEVLGSSLKLFFNGTLKAFATDRSLAGPGQIGIRGKEASLPGLQAFQLVGIPVTLPFQDDFSSGSDNNTQLSLAWQHQLGSFLLQGGLVKGNARTSIATLFGLSAADVSVQADVTVSGNGSQAQLLARYSGPGDRSYYLASLAESHGRFSVKLYRKVGGTNRLLKSANVVGGSHTLLFQVLGSSLSLAVDGSPILQVTDHAITAAGSVGLRGVGTHQTFANFQVQP
jgi:hypothetical protein